MSWVPKLPAGLDRVRRINLLLVLLVTGCLLADRFFGAVSGVQPALEIITWVAAGALALGVLRVQIKGRRSR